MLRYILLLSIGLLATCSCKQRESEKTEKQVETFTKTSDILVGKQEEQTIVSQPILALVRHVDSLGYIVDTSRYTPTQFTLFQVDKYLFFEISKRTTIPFSTFALLQETKKEKDSIVDRGNVLYIEPPMKDFDIKPLEKAQQVIQYYFKQKEPEITNGQKWYTDGIIEQWTFENQQQAQTATKELMNADLCVIYFNTCAFVCCMDNQMYIFHSRASTFMYTQKEFFNWFVKQNNISLFTKPTI